MSIETSSVPVDDATPMSLLAAHARDATAVFAVTLDEAGAATTTTYAGQLERVRRAAAVLSSHGVRPGDRVHLQAPNRHEFYDLWLAAGWLGAALVPTNPQSAAGEVDHVLSDCRPRVSISIEPDRERRAAPPECAFLGLDEFAALAAAADPNGAPATAVGRPQDFASVLYTSGTTSRPKGVLITHRNYVTVGEAVTRHLGVSRADRWLIALPLFHANAQYYPTMSALVTGASLVLAPRFSASLWVTQAARHEATLASLFAAPIKMILNHPVQERPTRLRAVLFAQNVSDAQAAAFEQLVGARLLQLWGMTETVLPPTVNPPSEARRWGSIGRPLPGVDVRLLDEGGREVPTGQIGEIHVAGELGTTLAAGYLNQPEATEETFGRGLLRTGDLARADGDGFLYFVDRAKDMIKRSGENIAAGEIERVLAAHPVIEDCAAIGIPDPLRDQAIVAYVVVKEGHATPGDEELRHWCAAQLAAFKVPEVFHVIAEMPRTSVGKIRKPQLLEWATQERAAQPA